jgi:hypothetical protein
MTKKVIQRNRGKPFVHRDALWYSEVTSGSASGIGDFNLLFKYVATIKTLRSESNDEADNRPMHRHIHLNRVVPLPSSKTPWARTVSAVALRDTPLGAKATTGELMMLC